MSNQPTSIASGTDPKKRSVLDGKSPSDPIKDFENFPLLAAIFGRRSRRFGRGMTIPNGPFAYKSTHASVPLCTLERDLLMLCGAGISGWNSGIEHTASGADDLGCNYPVRLVGRTYASAAGVHASELIINDDSGAYITQLRDQNPTRWQELAQSGDLDELRKTMWRHVARLSDTRVTIPAEAPHTAAHNLWNANKPGTTMFVPVVDVTQIMLDLLTIYLGMGLTPIDPRTNETCGDLRPYQRAGMIDATKRFSIVELEQQALTAAAMEVAQICHNITLSQQAMGLGGWLFGGLNAQSLMGGFDDVPGLGFRFLRDKRWFSPNPVGLDGHFEGLCPPYFPDMRAAIEHFDAMKFGEGGTFDPRRPGPYRETAAVKAKIERYSVEKKTLLGDVATYIFETYGKFPGTVPSVYIRAYVQAHHLDTDFYDKFYGPESYLKSHRQHFEQWHSHEKAPEAGDATRTLDALERRINASYAHNSRLYETFEATADLTAITEFLHWDAVQPPFSDYLSLWLPQALPCVKAVLEEHIDVEIKERHSMLFKDMLSHLDLHCPSHSRINHAVLKTLNYTFSEVCSLDHDFGFFLGGFFATETMSAKRCRQIYNGLRRLGIADESLTYFRIHFDADEGHAQEVRTKMIAPLLAERPDLLASVVEGAVDRLSRSDAFVRWYEAHGQGSITTVEEAAIHDA